MNPSTIQTTETVQISKQEFDYLKQMVGDHLRLCRSLDVLGREFAPILEAQEGKAQLNPLKLIPKLMPRIQQLSPLLQKEVFGTIIPIVSTYLPLLNTQEINPSDEPGSPEHIE